MSDTRRRPDLERNPAPNNVTICLRQPLTEDRAREVVNAAIHAYAKWDDASFRPRAPAPFEVYLVLELLEATHQGGNWLYGKFKGDILPHTDMTITVHNASDRLPPFGSLVFCLGQKRLSMPDSNFLLPVFGRNFDSFALPFVEATNLTRSELARLLAGSESQPIWPAVQAKRYGFVHELAPLPKATDEAPFLI